MTKQVTNKETYKQDWKDYSRKYWVSESTSSEPTYVVNSDDVSDDDEIIDTDDDEIV